MQGNLKGHLGQKKILLDFLSKKFDRFEDYTKFEFSM